MSYLGQFVKHLQWIKAAQKSVTRFTAITVLNLVTPKAASKHELLANKPTPGLISFQRNQRLRAHLLHTQKKNILYDDQAWG
jgi:hypothetical protein